MATSVRYFSLRNGVITLFHTHSEKRRYDARVFTPSQPLPKRIKESDGIDIVKESRDFDGSIFSFAV